MKLRLLDWIYPRVCSACARPVGGAGGVSFCADCDAALEWIAPPACPRCGAAREGPRPCRECFGKEFGFAGAVALGRYEGRLRNAVLAFKFRGERHLADEFGRRLAGRLERKFDLAVPVPMSRWKRLLRRYNAAELLAERLTRHAGMGFAPRTLGKARRTRPQAELPLEERLKNPLGAYRSRPVRGVVLLVDDVLTTGATANACTEALRAAGAAEVHLAVVAR